MTDFPDVNPAAISTLADSLKSVSGSMAGIGLDTEAVRDSVMGSEQWKGTASGHWYTVVTARVGDAGLTNEVMGSVATMLDGLAQDLESEQRLYQRMSDDLYTVKPQQGVMSRLDGPEMILNPDVQKSMDTCVQRAVQLLDDAARKLTAYALLADDIRAVPVEDRTPGVLAGANQQTASLQLLTILLGSVTGNYASGSKFEQAILRALGINKNTDIWRPNPPFEGKLTANGLAKGTTVDSKGSNYMVEIKGTSSLQFRFQLRLQVEQAKATGNPLWIVKAAGKSADPSVIKAAEGTQGGVIYTSDNGKTFTDGNGNPVKVTYDKATDTLKVSGYQRVPASSGGTGTDTALPSSPDPDAPQAPVNPATADESPAVPEVPQAPEVPDPEVPPVDPEIIP
jgi:hypothetical protein